MLDYSAYGGNAPLSTRIPAVIKRSQNGNVIEESVWDGENFRLMDRDVNLEPSRHG